MAEIENIATNRYRLRSHNHIITLSAQDVLDVYEYGLLNANTLTREAIASKDEQPTPRTLPGEQVPAYEGQEGVDWFHEDDVRAGNPAVQLDEE